LLSESSGGGVCTLASAARVMTMKSVYPGSRDWQTLLASSQGEVQLQRRALNCAG
jgi:hypothetical protein